MVENGQYVATFSDVPGLVAQKLKNEPSFFIGCLEIIDCALDGSAISALHVVTSFVVI